MARIDELRLMAKIARMYYAQGLRQTAICERLNIHQSTVSRVLKRAEREGIVRITVSLPPGTHTEIEEALQSRYGLDEAVVVDCLQDDAQIARDLGAAAAFYLENTMKPSDVIGISSWSAALLAMVNSMHPSLRYKGARVIQILGGVGSPNAEVHATQVTRRLADLIGGEATLLPAPGIVGSRDARGVLLKDRFVRQALDLFPKLTLALVGIGATEPSRALVSSGNVFSPQEIKLLAGKGAVGDICLRFFDAAGRQVITELNDRVISIDLEELRKVRRVVGVAGGRRKVSAIRGALAGKLINVLITDLASAEQLLAEAEEFQGPMMQAARTVMILSLCGWLGSCVPWTVRPIESETKAPQTAAAYVDSIWATKLVPAVMNSAIDARVLLDARANYTGSCCFLVKGTGTVLAVDSSSRVGLAMVDIAPFDRKPDLSIQIGPVLRGNALRDATGIVRFTDFVNQLQFADAGNEINDRVMKTVLAPVVKSIVSGSTVRFAGALEAREKTSAALAELAPVQLTVEAAR